MATIALGIVGNAILPGVGGFIGAAVGGLIDTYITLPLLFPTDPLQGPRLNDLQVTTATEGNPVKWAIGPKNRIGGTVIWMPPLKEVARTTGGKGGVTPEVTNYTYFASLAIGVVETRDLPGGKIKAIRKIWADTKVIYDDNGPTEQYASISIYKGDQTTPDALMEATEGVGLIPSYEGLAYVVIEDMKLAEFGNRVPNFTFLVEQESDVSLGEAIQLITNRGGLDSSEVDTTRLPQCFSGYVATGPQTITNLLNPLLMAYGIGCQDRNGVLTFFPRGAEYVVDVDVSDMAAHEDGDPNRPFQLTDPYSYDQPYQASVKFVSTDNDLQQGSQTYARSNAGNRSELVVDLPITMKPEVGLAIGKRMIWTAEAERQTFQGDLPPSYVGILEGDRLEFTYKGVLYQVFVAMRTRGNNGRIHIEGMKMQPHTYTYTAVAEGPGTTGTNSPYRPVNTVQAIMDCTSLHPDLVDSIGLYYSVCAEDPTKQWIGGALFTSTDNITYTSQAYEQFEATMGKCLNTLFAGTTEVMDTKNSVLIKLYNGSLNSCTYDQMIDGTNRMLVQTSNGDWELIGFMTAELIGTNTYKVSRLLRGLRGTEHLVDKHFTNAKCVLVQEGPIGFLAQTSAQLGVTKYYKSPSTQGNVEDFDAEVVTLQGRSAMPFSPCNGTIYRDPATNDITVSWTRRTKSFSRLFGPAGTPFTPDELPEAYIVELLVAADPDAAVERIATVLTNSWTYTAAEQTADGRTLGVSVITVKVYQKSNAVGKGTPAYFSFT